MATSSMQRRCCLALAVAGVCVMGAGKALARPILPGNFWPNPTLEIPDAGDPTQPDGWHRGGSNGAICVYDTTQFVSSNHSLHDADTDLAGYGEWYYDPAVLFPGGVNPGDDLLVRMNRMWDVVEDSGEMRVSIVWHRPSGFFADTHFVVTGTQSTWLEQTFQVTIPATADGLRFVVTSGGPSQTLGDLFVDDISVAAVPEPGSMLAIAGATALLARRRSR